MKFTGNYTTGAGKALKNADRLYCRIDEDGAIYLCNSYLVFRMNELEYSATVQPATKCDAGNWIIERGEKREAGPADFNPKKALDDAIKAANEARRETILQRCPLEMQVDKNTMTAFYSASAGFAAFYNRLYIAAFDPCCTFHATGATSPAIVMAGSEAVGMVLPIKPRPEAVRAVAAWFTAPAEDDKPTDEKHAARRVELLEAEAAELKNKIAEQAAELDKLRAELDELHNATEAATVEQPAAPVDVKSAAEVIAARFAELDGVRPVIKGATTSAPVVWLDGETEKHADAIRAAGAKWSGKRNAYYIRVA